MAGLMQGVVDIPSWIDGNGSAYCLINNAIGSGCYTAEIVLWQQHAILLFCVLLATSLPRQPNRLSASMKSKRWDPTVMVFSFALSAVQRTHTSYTAARVHMMSGWCVDVKMALLKLLPDHPACWSRSYLIITVDGRERQGFAFLYMADGGMGVLHSIRSNTPYPSIIRRITKGVEWAHTKLRWSMEA